VSYDDRNLLDVLRAELAFLASDGYRKGVPQWRPAFYFEDSPTCMNHGAPAETRRPCKECLFAHLVPREARMKQFPCRYISLDADGRTLDNLYRTGTEAEIHDALSTWLRKTIAQLETIHPAPPFVP
jgi:hypothetical protein